MKLLLVESGPLIQFGRDERELMPLGEDDFQGSLLVRISGPT